MGSFGCMLALVMTEKRSQLRLRFGTSNSPETRGKFFSDFCVWWCCFPCVVVQEARQVDAAQGAKADCSMVLTTWDVNCVSSNPAVGAAVMVVGRPLNENAGASGTAIPGSGIEANADELAANTTQ